MDPTPSPQPPARIRAMTTCPTCDQKMRVDNLKRHMVQHTGPVFGRVYAIRSPHGNLVYIGSTQRPLAYRLSEHVRDYKRWAMGVDVDFLSSFHVFDLGEAYIEAIDEAPFVDIASLRARERAHILKTPNVVNIHVPRMGDDIEDANAE